MSLSHLKTTRCPDCAARVLRMCDGVFLLAFALVVLGFTPVEAFAYVDPSVMTYTIQALAGVAVALSTVLGVVYRRMRKRMVNALGIDENAGKVVEPDVVEAEGDDWTARDTAARMFWENAPVPGQAKRLGFGGRFARALVVSVFCWFSLLVAAPFELIVANATSLTYRLSAAWVPLVVAAVVLSIVCALLLACVRGRAFDVLLAVLAACGVGAWVQAMFLNGGLPAADGATIDWVSFALQMVASALVWAALIAVAVVCVLRWTRQARFGIAAASCALIAVQTAGLFSLTTMVADPRAESPLSATDIYMTQEGLLTLSPSNNVVVFVLDMYDTSYLMDAFRGAPYLQSTLTGFTWYTDSAGSAIPTRFGVPYLLTGEMPQVGQTYTQYVSQRYQNSTFLEDIAGQGYDLGIYTDSLGPEFTWRDKVSLVENIHEQADIQADPLGTVFIMLKTSLYRDVPWILKPLFWYHTDEVNQRMGGSNLTGDFASRPYTMNDAAFGDAVQTRGLTIEDAGSTGSFRFIHLDGAHWPYVLDETGRDAGGTTSLVRQSIGSMHIVELYLNQMKELGVYDDATIIITADHGLWEDTIETCRRASSPILLVKPAQTHEQAQTSLVRVDDVPTGHVDYPATVIDAVGGDASAYGTPVGQVVPGSSRERTYFYLKHDSPNNKDFELQEYVITGNVLNFANWTRTYRVLPNDDLRLHS